MLNYIQIFTVLLKTEQAFKQYHTKLSSNTEYSQIAKFQKTYTTTKL